jgi:hypothetical protein
MGDEARRIAVKNIAKLPEAHVAKRSSEPLRIEKDHIYYLSPCQ